MRARADNKVHCSTEMGFGVIKPSDWNKMNDNGITYMPTLTLAFTENGKIIYLPSWTLAFC